MYTGDSGMVYVYTILCVHYVGIGLGAECVYMYVCPFFMAHFTETAYSSRLLSVCLGQVDLQMATEGADSVLVRVICDGHVTVTCSDRVTVT